jgi:hypothetical protein
MIGAGLDSPDESFAMKAADHGGFTPMIDIWGNWL